MQQLPVIDKSAQSPIAKPNIRQSHTCNSFSSRTVPTGVSKVFVNATGCSGVGAGGRGGWVQALLQVSAGQTLYIYVCNVDRNGGGPSGWPFNRGGGATDIRTIPGNLTSRHNGLISGNLTSRLIIAGGGGGGGYTTVGGNGGAKMRMR
jgi:Glycine rich protein